MSENYLNLSDEDFLNMTAPEEDPVNSGSSASEEAVKEEPVVEDNQDSPKAADAEESPSEEPASEVDRILQGLAPEQPSEDPKKEEEKDPSSLGSQPEGKEVEGTEENSEEPTTMEQLSPEDILKRIMAPFKANGKTFEVKTPEEAIRLMQMGAGYGKKLHSIQQNVKVVKTLERAGIDQEQLSFLIDLQQGKKEAIQKLLKDTGFDPLDYNPDEDVSYTPTDHRVSDSEVSFEQALEDIREFPTGQQTIRTINTTWDQASKNVLFEQPELLGIMQTQRDMGIYDTIVDEIDRRKVLGLIPHNTPFLSAYKTVGDDLVSQNALSKQPSQHVDTPSPESLGGHIPVQPSQPAPVVQQPVAARVYAPKPTVINGDKAKAASSTKTSNTRKQAPVNPLAMSDEDFTKLLGQMNRF